MTSVYYAFIYIFETLISVLYFNNKITPKYKKNILVIPFGVSFILQYLVNFIGIPNINLVVFIICNFLVCFLCFKSTLPQALFHSILLAALMLISELIIVYIAKIFFGIAVTDHIGQVSCK